MTLGWVGSWGGIRLGMRGVSGICMSMWVEARSSVLTQRVSHGMMMKVAAGGVGGMMESVAVEVLGTAERLPVAATRSFIDEIQIQMQA